MIYNLSFDKKNFSQRLNTILPHHTCTITSMVQCLYYLGYDVDEHTCDELTEFILEDDRVLGIFSKLYPRDYDNYVYRRKGFMYPFEFHNILSYAVNLFMGKPVTVFNEKCNINTIIDNVIRGFPVIVSCKLPNYDSDTVLNHVVTIVGVDYEYIDNKRKINKVFIDDTYGKTMYYDSNKREDGNDVALSYEEFLNYMKPLDNCKEKWAHLFCKY